MKAVGVVVVIVLVSLMASCTQTPVQSSPPTPIKTEPWPEQTGRPDIPRTNPPQDMPDVPQYQNPGEQPHGQTPVFVNVTPKAELQVPVGDSIGDQYPIITVGEFKLLKHQPIRVSSNSLVGYREELRFDFGENSTGKIIFAKDDVTGNIGSFLKFEERKPIFEYRVVLDRGTFESLQGRDIQILGHTYTIAQATNTSVYLFGKDIANNFAFEHNRALTVNSSNQAATLCYVTPNTIAYELFTDGKDRGDILLSPGESLVSNIGWQKLASRLFDIRYKEASTQSTTVVSIARTQFGYVLNADLVNGRTEIPLVERDAGKVILGRTTDRLRITPCPYNTYCVAPEDNLLFTTPDGKSYLRRYGGASENPSQVHFYDQKTGSYTYEFVGTPGVDAHTDIIVNKIAFSARIGPKDNATNDYNISVEQGYRNGRVELVLADGTILRIGDITNTTSNTTLPLEFVIAGSRTKDRAETRFSVTLVWDGDWHIDGGNLTYVEDERSLDTTAQTQYGATIVLAKNRRSLPANQGDSATIIIPHTQGYGIVSLEG